MPRIVRNRPTWASASASSDTESDSESGVKTQASTKKIAKPRTYARKSNVRSRAAKAPIFKDGEQLELDSENEELVISNPLLPGIGTTIILSDSEEEQPLSQIKAKTKENTVGNTPTKEKTLEIDQDQEQQPMDVDVDDGHVQEKQASQKQVSEAHGQEEEDELHSDDEPEDVKGSTNKHTLINDRFYSASPPLTSIDTCDELQDALAHTTISKPTVKPKRGCSAKKTAKKVGGNTSTASSPARFAPYGRARPRPRASSVGSIGTGDEDVGIPQAPRRLPQRYLTSQEVDLMIARLEAIRPEISKPNGPSGKAIYADLLASIDVKPGTRVIFPSIPARVGPHLLRGYAATVPENKTPAGLMKAFGAGPGDPALMPIADVTTFSFKKKDEDVTFNTATPVVAPTTKLWTVSSLLEWQSDSVGFCQFPTRSNSVQPPLPPLLTSLQAIEDSAEHFLPHFPPCAHCVKIGNLACFYDHRTQSTKQTCVPCTRVNLSCEWAKVSPRHEQDLAMKELQGLAAGAGADPDRVKSATASYNKAKWSA